MTGPAPEASARAEGGIRSFLERHFHLAAALLLLTMAAVQFSAMQMETVANDEGYYLLAGYEFLKTGRLPLTTEHPPLGELIPAVPLLFLDLQVPGRPAYVPPDQSEQRTREQMFVFANRRSPETILRVARSADIVLTLMLGVVLLWWTRRHFGAIAALAAATLFTFDPNFIAHGHYTMTDVPVTFAFLAAVLSWNAFLADGRLSKAAICGVFTGIAISTKYNAGLLIPIYVLLYLIGWWQHGRWSMKHLVKSMAAAGVVAFLTAYAIFGFETEPLLPPYRMIRPMLLSQKLAAEPDSLGRIGHWLLQHPAYMHTGEYVVQRMPVPVASLFRGLGILTQHQVGGHPSYFMGMYSAGGWWYYFPVVMAVKTPTGLLLLFLLAVVVSAGVLFRNGMKAAVGKLKTLNPDWYALAIPCLFYFAVCLRSHINIGIRHILPMYPFIFIWVAAVLFSRRLEIAAPLRRVAVVGLALVAAESAMAYPNYLGFFNVPSGGMRTGWKYVVDSNMDLGQDLQRLKNYLVGHGYSNVCMAYFGAAPLPYFAIPSRDVPASLEEARKSGCVVAMSITQLMFDRRQAGRYLWLDARTPADIVGSSYWIYDLRDKR